MKLRPRAQRVLYPDGLFEKSILKALEQGTLQNQLFDDPSSKTHAFMRGFLGGFFRIPPVKQALLSKTLRSRFLAVIKKGAIKQKKGHLAEL
jgi:hypothetical protein